MAEEGAQQIRTALHRQSRTPGTVGESVEVDGGRETALLATGKRSVKICEIAKVARDYLQ
jgi:hypothetical protein